MRNNDAANGETRAYFSPGPSRGERTLSVKHTDFSVQIVSGAFRGKVCVLQTALYSLFSRAALQNTLQRHRMVNAALADEFKSGLHALSLTTKTPEELPKDA